MSTHAQDDGRLQRVCRSELGVDPELRRGRARERVDVLHAARARNELSPRGAGRLTRDRAAHRCGGLGGTMIGEITLCCKPAARPAGSSPMRSPRSARWVFATT